MLNVVENNNFASLQIKYKLSHILWKYILKSQNQHI